MLMTNEAQHISVCVCTYKRVSLLRRLLQKLAEQETDQQFTYSVVVVDNDRMQSAEATVREFATASSVPITYHVEARQNICLARNKAIENASGNLVAFIDDDEFPERRWLVALFNTCNRDGIAGVLGPVKSYFDEQPPMWVVKCEFFDRPAHPTGFVIDWREGRTGNVLLKKEFLEAGIPPFNAEFHRGGDTDFFRRMIQRGCVFLWSDEAVVYEVVPPARWTRTFMLKRALLRGTITLQNPSFGFGSVIKSIVAVLAYTAALPFTVIFGHHRFMNVLVRLCDHMGKLLAVVGINPVKSPYVTD
jgi:glycosyltransferase involved in cell wall biosynthesis